MKLIVVLSVIACGYAAKLDRTYLPPSSAATAGGSPGAITAPDAAFGRRPAADFGQDLPNGPATKPFGQPIAPSGPESNQASLSGSRPSFGQPGNQGSNQAFPDTFKDNEISGDLPRPGQFNAQGSRAPFGKTPDSFNEGDASRPAPDSQGSRAPFGQEFSQEQRAERPQAAADRNAEILKYVNENNGDSYEYSYETSNGIAAEESGVATNGVMAQGGFSYTGDDGKAYSITYTADENGFQPQGEHLPTPHPIPEEILRSIEENARAAASGTQEGAYRPEEYESESTPQQYGNGAQRPQQGVADIFSQRKPGQGSLQSDRQAPQNQYTQSAGNNDYSDTSRQQSQRPSNDAFDAPSGQRPGDNGYNYNKPTQGQDQRGLSKQNPQVTGNTGDNDTSSPAGRRNQFNQPQRNQPGRQPTQGFNGQYQNQGRPSNQYSPQQNGQAQDDGYNYNRPQTKSPGSQSQRVQPSGFGNNILDLSGQPQGPEPNSYQQRPQFTQNQFDNQPQKSPLSQNQRQNGYTYNQPQNQQYSGQGSPGSKFRGNQQNKQRPTSTTDNAFERPQGPMNQYSQGSRGQDQGSNGYNYNQPQKTSGPQPGQSPNFSKGVTSQSGPQGGSNNQFGRLQRPTQGPISGNQQGPSNKFPSGQKGQDRDENGYYYNRPQNTQTQGPFGQRPQSGVPNQPEFSPRPTSSFDSNNQGSRPGSMKPTFGQNRPGSNTDRQQYSPESRPTFGSAQIESKPQSYDSPRPTDKFQPSLAPASPFRPQQPSQTRPTSFGTPGQNSANQSQTRPSLFGPSGGDAASLGPSRPSSGPSSQNADQTLAQGYQYGPGQTNKPQRLGPNGQLSGTPGAPTPGATKGPGSEFGGPRQPPSFSPEEGYKY